ncbi:hypothetical protein [Methylobacterium sp. A54F]
MAAVTFDTLKLARTLRDKAKLSAEQAEGLAEGLADAMAETIRGDLATKVDLAETKSEIIRWVTGLIAFQTLAIIGTVIALARVFRP